MSVSLPPPARFAGAFRYEHTDVPPQLTLAEWRRQRRPRSRRGTLVRRLRRLVGGRS
jgi:hypothetical protein